MERDDGGWLVGLPTVSLAGVLILLDATVKRREPAPRALIDLGIHRLPPPGVLSVGALVLLVLVAGLVHLQMPPLAVTQGVTAILRGLILPLTLAGSTVVVFGLPQLLSENGKAHSLVGASFTSWMRLLLAAFLAVLAGKVSLLRRYSATARARHSVDDILLSTLLGTQRDDLEDIRGAIFGVAATEEARVIQVEGRWGDGKSFLLSRLEAYLSAKPEARAPRRARPVAAVVPVDVWKHEAEPDLHLAVVEELLGHPAYLAGLGWLQYPIMLAPGRYIASVLMKLTIPGVKAGGVDLGVKLPRLPWQRAFQSLVARQHRRGFRTIIVLDEVDRATASMSQVAITLTRRALDLRGVTVVLSYVDELIRYKVFNPLIARPLPDLQSSMEAEIYEEMLDERAPIADGPAIDSVVSRVAYASVEARFPSGRYTGRAAEDFTQQPDAESRSANQTPTDPDLGAALRAWYAGSPAATRALLQRRFSEKFLGLRPIRLRRLSHEDIASMVFTFGSLRELAAAVGGIDEEACRAGVVAGLGAWEAEQELVQGTAPPVRALEGGLAEVLRAANVRPGLVPSPDTLAYYVVVAFDAVVLRSRR